MTTLGPRASHDPPIPSPSRPNLLSSVAAEARPTTGRWQHGIAYQPERAGGGSSVDPCGDVGEGVKTVTAGPGVVEWDPYIIWTGDRCSTIGTDYAEIEARARRQLDTQTSDLLESILWSNVVDGGDFGGSHPNVGLREATAQPNGFSAYPVVKAFSDMIAALGAFLGGARGMIHVERRLIPFLAFYGLTVQNGQRLITTLGDHIVVPGTGYPGTDPAGNEPGEFHSWIYGTSMVEVLLGEIEVFTDRVAATDRAHNDVEYRAERIALAHWDRTAHIGVSVCLEDPAGDCSDAGS
jgi:hypothetical protein